MLEVKERRGLTGHPDVEGRMDRAYVTHELLGRFAQRPVNGRHCDQRQVRTGRLGPRDPGHIREPTNAGDHGPDLIRACGGADHNLEW